MPYKGVTVLDSGVVCLSFTPDYLVSDHDRDFTSAQGVLEQAPGLGEQLAL